MLGNKKVKFSIKSDNLVVILKNTINLLLADYLSNFFTEIFEENRLATLILLLAISAILNFSSLIAFQAKKVFVEKYKIISSLFLDTHYTYSVSIA